jgi:hypothetical protein
MRLAKPRSISARTLASAASDGPFNPHSVGPFQVFGARSRTVDYVREEVAERLIERMLVSLLLSSMQRGKKVE